MISCLLLACSKRKRIVSGSVPALDLYDGGAYRVVRKLRRERGLPDGLHILILSARYGLLKAEESIELYDRLMDVARAEALRATVSARLDDWLREVAPARMYVRPGPYLPAGNSVIGGVPATAPGRQQSRRQKGRPACARVS